MKFKKIISLATIACLSVVGIATSVVSCGRDYNRSVHNGTITLFNPNQVYTLANKNYSLDSSYSGASLSNSMGQTSVSFQNYATTGQYSDWKYQQGFTKTPKTTVYNSLLDSTNTDMSQLTTNTPDADGFYTTTIPIKKGFGYVDHNGNPVKDANGKKLTINKWDLLLDASRVEMSYENKFGQNGYYVTMIGLDINATLAANIANPDPYTFILKTSHVSPAAQIISQEYFSAPTPVGYVSKLIAKHDSEWGKQSLESIIKSDDFPIGTKATDNKYKLKQGNYKRYVIDSIKYYGEDSPNDYSKSNVVYSGKYYMSAITRNISAQFKLNPYYNMGVKGFADPHPEYTNKGLNDSHVFQQINEVLSNQNSASDPAEKAYALWRDGQIDMVPSKLVTSDKINDILKHYKQDVYYSGSSPESQSDNICFNMNIWNKGGGTKSKVSANYEKLAKQFYSPAAQNLRYNLMRATNFVSVSKTINPENPSDVKNSLSPLEWNKVVNGKLSVDTPKVQAASYKDNEKLNPVYGRQSLLGGNTTKELNTASLNGKFTTKTIPNINWAGMQNQIQNDLKTLGITKMDPNDPNDNPNGAVLNIWYRTLDPYTATELDAIKNIGKAWRAVSNGKIDLNVDPLTTVTRDEIYQNQNAEIASNFWSPDFAGGVGSWVKAFGMKISNAADIVYGLAKSGALDGKVSVNSMTGATTAQIQSHGYDFSDFSQYVITNWNSMVKGGPIKAPAPANATALANLIIKANDGQSMKGVVANNWTSALAQSYTSRISDLLSFWLNKNEVQTTNASHKTAAEKGYWMTSWMNVQSISVPYANKAGYTAARSGLAIKGLFIYASQSQQKNNDWTDLYSLGERG